MAAADAAADALINISHLYKKYTLGDSNTIINALFDVSFELFLCQNRRYPVQLVGKIMHQTPNFALIVELVYQKPRE